MFSFIRQTNDYLVISLRVKLRSSKSGPIVVSNEAKELQWGIKALPVDGKANAELTRSVSKFFGIKKNEVMIISGHTSRLKALALHNLPLAQAINHLQKINYTLQK